MKKYLGLALVGSTGTVGVDLDQKVASAIVALCVSRSLFFSHVVCKMEDPKVELNREQVKATLKEFIDLSKQIKDVRKELKVINERRKELEVTLTDYMHAASAPALRCDVGTVKLVDTKSVKPINKDGVFDVISSKVDPSIAKELSELVFSCRPVIPVQKVRVSFAKAR